MTAFEKWYNGLDWAGAIERGDPDFPAFCHDHKTACRVAFEAGQAAGPDAPQIVSEHLVECQSCDNRITLPVSQLGVMSLRGLKGWRFTTGSGWTCPKHHGGASDA